MIFTSLGQRITVRYARKPIWLPTAPSKLFRIPKHDFYTPQEIERIHKLSNEFRNQEAAIREYFKHEFYIPATKAGGLPQEFIDREKEENQQRLKENQEENARIAVVREQAMSDQLKKLETRLLDTKCQMEEDLLKEAMKVDEYIDKQLSDPKSIVTRDNIEQVIDEAMDNPVNFEFYIDKSGKHHYY